MKIIELFKKDYETWCNKDYKIKCKDIAGYIYLACFMGVIMYALGPMDYLNYIDDASILLASELESLDESQATFIKLGYIGGVLLLPVILLHYISMWSSYGLMYLVYIRYKRMSKK